MIVAGIDEAGYGPLLGPLTVGCCAFEVQERPTGEAADDGGGGTAGAAAEMPCIWSRLRKLVSRNRLRTGRKIHVNDSKLVYSPSVGLGELERAILALSAASGEWCDDLNALVRRMAPDAAAHLAEYPWYRPTDDERFPIVQDGLPIQLFAKALRQEMSRSGATCVHLRARVVCEKQLNAMFEATRNKASTLFSIAAIHIDQLLREYAGRNLTIMCDRQGGRGYYGGLLRLMFDDWSLAICSETETRAEYLLTRDGHSARIIFCEKAEAQCLPVAVASMLAKYLREAMMHRFNNYWTALVPNLSPTAGYYNDGIRFLGDIDAKRTELGVEDQQLIRSR